MGEGNIYWKTDASQICLKIFSQDYGKLLKVTLWEWHAKLARKYCFIRGKPLQWCWVAQHKQVTIGGTGPALFKPDGKVSIDRPVLSEWFPHPVQSRAPELFLGTLLLRYFFFFFFTYLAQQPERLFSAREVEDKFGEVTVLWQLQFAGDAAADIHPWKQFKTLSLLFTSKCLEWQIN